MNNEVQLDQLVTQLGQVNTSIERLENVDYMTAMYKGYSAAGETVDEIVGEIDDLREQASLIEAQINELEDSLY
ncbi:hypothetical protein FD04_GL000301 [Secundilactobacillus odoratitofui DSM 19909 = JCM 15043]|uniref:Uncharacterized protein n=1 Tax=Secundilactobacillus odoratitofui DSM 19909 = JCM 15043 TaxID=1423776 RepID=A0A0R1M0C2_9LACO|nr:hypothetical protein [Secundilactobacillus odoratitofui]KRK98569.1 hypothetical protein FD04_GL000301 [Secundilactobacillus odoratitofui DSM 19909 = JCM 15043]